MQVASEKREIEIFSDMERFHFTSQVQEVKLPVTG